MLVGKENIYIGVLIFYELALNLQYLNFCTYGWLINHVSCNVISTQNVGRVSVQSSQNASFCSSNHLATGVIGQLE